MRAPPEFPFLWLAIAVVSALVLVAEYQVATRVRECPCARNDPPGLSGDPSTWYGE